MDIKLLVMDVDGTLTDGMLYFGEKGELFKTFNIKDGCGIKDILPEYNIIPVIITARNSKILELRCIELGIVELHQGVRKKLNCLNSILKSYSEKDNTTYSLKNVAYIGDDILDLQCMSLIKTVGGIVGCPADAINKVKDIADFVSEYDGGRGAVRDFIHYIISE